MNESQLEHLFGDKGSVLETLDVYQPAESVRVLDVLTKPAVDYDGVPFLGVMPVYAWRA